MQRVIYRNSLADWVITISVAIVVLLVLLIARQFSVMRLERCHLRQFGDFALIEGNLTSFHRSDAASDRTNGGLTGVWIHQPAAQDTTRSASRPVRSVPDRSAMDLSLFAAR